MSEHHAAATAAHEGLDFSELIAHHLGDQPLSHAARDAATAHGFVFTKHMLVLSIAALVTAAVVFIASRTRGSLRTVIEGFVLFIRSDIAVPAMGDEDAEAYLPFLLTLFLFIFFMNLLGLIPESAAATGNISVTATLAFSTFLLIHIAGMWRHGIVGHWKNMIPHGVPLVMVPLVFAIEGMGYVTKALALCIRLFANMTAGHLVILLFLGLILLFGQSDPWTGLVVAPIAVGMALGLYALELLVALIQAYVFTMLTAIFVGGALHPSH